MVFVVTGGAGFIGSNIVAELAAEGRPVVVCDRLGSDERWKNLAKHELVDLITPERLIGWLDAHAGRVKAVIHMGAISATTETDVGALVDQNIRATLDLFDWCAEHKCPLIYASSAATYGDGSAGFEDDASCDALAKLRPLNAYGWSKHLVDRRIARIAQEQAPRPSQCVGLKFFNVFGPNEYHKGSMRSLIASHADRVARGEPLRLFKSGNPDYADGGQKRDFIYVKDCVRVVLWFLDHPDQSGLFNVGTGCASTWLELSEALFGALRRPVSIDFIELPDSLRDRYQYFTQASMKKIRAAGFDSPMTPLAQAVDEYVNRYLRSEDPYA